MKLVLLGAPGAGKGTQADRLCERLKIPTISTGNILRAAMRDGTPVGIAIQDAMDAGQLVPDELIIDIVMERLAQQDCENGWILDGFPRTIPQAEALEQSINAPDWAVSIEVEDAVIVERMGGRRTCPDCGATYHIVNNPPAKEGVCDVCGTELVIRKDDAPETVLSRLETYHHTTEPLKAFYGVLGKLKLAESQPGIEATTDLILKELEV